MATATAAAGIAGGAAKFFSGRAQQRKGEKFINNFKWQELKDPYGDLAVSTLGADMRKEEASRTTATSVDALSQGGARTLLGGLGKVQDSNNQVNKDIAAGLDEQQKNLDKLSAGQIVANQTVIEKRQGDELAGYGQMVNTGMGQKWAGVDGAINALASYSNSIEEVGKAALGAAGGAAGGAGGAAG
jgi:hypothetical protein